MIGIYTPISISVVETKPLTDEQKYIALQEIANLRSKRIEDEISFIQDYTHCKLDSLEEASRMFGRAK